MWKDKTRVDNIIYKIKLRWKETIFTVKVVGRKKKQKKNNGRLKNPHAGWKINFEPESKNYHGKIYEKQKNVYRNRVR